jgi:hypothetical protein
MKWQVKMMGSVALSLGVAMAAAVAQPSVIGNRANGLSYQPTQSEVVPREQNAGVAQSPQHARQADAEVERLNRELQNKENHDPQLHPGR